MSNRLVVLASGTGTNLQAVIDGCANGAIDARVVAVVSDQTAATALERARAAGIEAIALPRRENEVRVDYDTRLAATVAEHRPDWVVLAGWMRILTMRFLGQFPERVVNIHPALPGEFPGTNAIERAFEAGRDHTGVMIHLVPDEGVDNGPVLGTVNVGIHPDDTLDTLRARMHDAEHELLVTTLSRLCTQEVTA
jgi:phosphoribosylglycinamide formyltransferase 1